MEHSRNHSTFDYPSARSACEKYFATMQMTSVSGVTISNSSAFFFSMTFALWDSPNS
jgi:hypothetical protein